MTTANRAELHRMLYAHQHQRRGYHSYIDRRDCHIKSTPTSSTQRTLNMQHQITDSTDYNAPTCINNDAVYSHEP